MTKWSVNGRTPLDIPVLPAQQNNFHNLLYTLANLHCISYANLKTMSPKTNLKFFLGRGVMEKGSCLLLIIFARLFVSALHSAWRFSPFGGGSMKLHRCDLPLNKSKRHHHASYCLASRSSNVNILECYLKLILSKLKLNSDKIEVQLVCRELNSGFHPSWKNGLASRPAQLSLDLQEATD